MIATYKARLLGNMLDWQEESPPVSSSTVSVLVTVLPHPDTPLRAHEPTGSRLAAILKRLARENTVPSIPNPVEWQKEMRRDRVLPGRED
jgi:hypothetical protein